MLGLHMYDKYHINHILLSLKEIKKCMKYDVVVDFLFTSLKMTSPSDKYWY